MHIFQIFSALYVIQYYLLLYMQFIVVPAGVGGVFSDPTQHDGGRGAAVVSPAPCCHPPTTRPARPAPIGAALYIGESRDTWQPRSVQ